MYEWVNICILVSGVSEGFVLASGNIDNVCIAQNYKKLNAIGVLGNIAPCH